MPEETTETTTSATDTDAAGKLAALEAEVEKWKAMSRKNEERAKENAEAVKKAADAQKRLEEIEAAKLTDAEKAERRLRDLEASVKSAQEAQKSAELAALKARIGAEKGVPAKFIPRLQGEDEDSIAADCDEILAAIPDDAKQAWPDLGQGKGGGESAVADPLLAEVMKKIG